MAAGERFAFGSFRFDGRTGQLWRGHAEVKLTPRAAAVLNMLAERAPELVTKQELFDRVWERLAVGDDALTSCIQELRGALGDDARRPRMIETRHRRGYRLMAPVSLVIEGLAAAAAMSARPEPTRLVGRDAELAALARAFEEARAGRRQVVLVSGEPGIGKSALSDAFLDELRAARTARIAHGQCLDHHGVGEPYLPLIEAVTRLARGPDGTIVKEILSTEAPSWLAQMPSLWTRGERSALEARGRATRDRMLRELAHAVEAIATDLPFVLKLEDIHWSDASTRDWIAHMARRPEPACLMLLATLRPADPAAARAGLDRLVSELALHGWCREIALPPLSVAAIETYLKSRLGEDSNNSGMLASLLLERTGGNPLFMSSIVSQLAGRDAAERMLGAIPPDVRRFIDRQIEELDQGDRDILMAASIVGREFSTAAIAAALESEVDTVEAVCARLGRQGIFIGSSGTTVWPDGARTELYAFRHDLHRELLYARLATTRRALSHARLGRRLEAAWAGRLDAIASELAEHFDRGHEPVRAIPHHRRAAAKALRRSANEEAIGHLRRALDAVGAIADQDERAAVEIGLLIALGAAHMAMRGFGAPEVLEAYSRAEALCDRFEERVDLFPAIWGQWMFRTGRGETDAARRLGARLLGMAEKAGDTGLKIQAHHAMWSTCFVSGEFAQSCAHARSAIALFDPGTHQPMASSYGNHDAACCARNFSALSLALAGDSEGARAMMQQALAAARALGDPFSLALTLYFTAATAQMLGDVALATANSTLSLQMARDHDLAQPRAWSMGVAGWCAAESGDVDRGLALATQAVGAMRTIQSRHFLVYLLGLSAEAQRKAGDLLAAMTAVEEALALTETTGERFYSAELHRLKGELLAQPPWGEARDAEAAFRTAITLARGQGAVTLERRAAASLRHWFATTTR